MGNPLGLDGKVAVVTGASRGLGRAVAHKLCASGAHVLLNYTSSADAAVESMAGLPGTATPIRGDIRAPETVRDLVDTAVERHGRLDVFRAQRGNATADVRRAGDVPALRDEHSLALDPLLHGAALFAKAMTDGGRVIVISGNGAGKVIPGYVAVGTAKAALESLVRYLAVELAPSGIAVTRSRQRCWTRGRDSKARWPTRRRRDAGEPHPRRPAHPHRPMWPTRWRCCVPPRRPGSTVRSSPSTAVWGCAP